MNANNIANGILSSLVSITAACPFVDYWAAILIGCECVCMPHDRTMNKILILGMLEQLVSACSYYSTKRIADDYLGAP